MVNVCVYACIWVETERGKIHFWSLYGLLISIVFCECTRACVRARYLINNWLNISAPYTQLRRTRGRACMHANTKYVHTIWNVDNFFILLWMYIFSLSIIQFMNLTRTLYTFLFAYCISKQIHMYNVMYICMDCFCHTNAFTRVYVCFFRLFCIWPSCFI